jgi:predicted DCC family thiol-disulfide oxidoreductase YuxK
MATAAGQAIVLYDGDCPLCRKTTAILERLDWFGRLRFHNCRDTACIPPNTAQLDPERMIQEMHVLTPDRTRAYAGFRAVRWIAGRVPVLWPLYLLLFIPGMPTVGQRLYPWVARNRFHLVPCRGRVCTIPPKRSGVKTGTGRLS